MPRGARARALARRHVAQHLNALHDVARLDHRLAGRRIEDRHGRRTVGREVVGEAEQVVTIGAEAEEGVVARLPDLGPARTGVAHLLGGPGTSFTASPKDVKAGERLKTETEAAAVHQLIANWEPLKSVS